MRIKICGITTPDQGRAIAQMGASALGFICVQASPRYVTPTQIRAVMDVLDAPPTLTPLPVGIGVFANSALEDIVAVVERSHLGGVQLHGQESPAFCQQLRAALPDREIIKAFRIHTATDLLQVNAFCNVVDAVLLDAYHPRMLGGTGQTLDWEALRQFQPSLPWFLAGGLTPANVQEALRQLQPSGIDLSSGVERSPGDKDLTKVAKLFEALMSFNTSKKA